MATQTAEIYFTGTIKGSNGYVWDSNVLGNQYTGGAPLKITGKALLMSSALSADVTWNVQLGTNDYSAAGGGCQALNQIILTFPDGTTKTLYDATYGCGTWPITCGCAGSSAGSYTLTDSELETYAGQSLTLTLTAFQSGAATNDEVEWIITCYIAETIPVVPAVLTVDVSGANGNISGATVIVDDTTQGQAYQGTTGSDGTATFDQVNLGDTIALTVEATGYDKYTAGFSIDVVNQAYPVSMTTTGGVVGNELAAVGKYLLVAAGVIGGIAIGYEALKAYQSHEYAKRYNPPPQYVINEAEQKALEYKPS